MKWALLMFVLQAGCGPCDHRKVSCVVQDEERRRAVDEQELRKLRAQLDECRASLIARPEASPSTKAAS